MKISLKDAISFHGHLGPYVVLGLLMGDFGLKKIKSRKYFGLKVKVWGADKKPKSCLVDGLQLSTGATYGKGNIEKLPGKIIKIRLTNKETGRTLAITLNKELINGLDTAKTH